MLSSGRFMVCASVAGMLVSLGGCVSSATHKKTLASLDHARAELQRVRADRNVLEQDNTRLKGGLTALANRCRSARMRVLALNAAVSRLKVHQKRVAGALDKLYQAVSSQTGSTAALEAASSPLANEMADIQAKTAALLREPPTPPQGTVATTALDVSSAQETP